MSIGVLILRRRRLIALLTVLGGVLGLTAGLLTPRMYRSTAVFIPQASDSDGGGLAAAASQLGFSVPASGGAWGPPLYVELLESRAILDSIATDSIEVRELGRRVATADLLEVDAGDRARRVELTVRALRDHIDVAEDGEIGGVRLSVVTPFPSASQAIADSLVHGVNRFNIHIRKSQAASERAFVEAQATIAERDLREAEGRLQAFLQGNRAVSGSPQLTFTRDRLQRDVALRQEMHLTWLKNREDARIREVRNTPVITVLEEPRLPAVGESRKVLFKAVFGAMAGTMIGIAFALVTGWLASLRSTPNPEEREFLELATAVLPWRRRSHVVNS